MPPPPSALCPHPAPRPRLLKGRHGVRVRCLGRHLQEVFPAPALCPARGPPASPRADSRRDGLTGSRAKVLSRQPGRSGQRAPQPLFVRGLRSRERVPRARPCGALSRSTALALSTTPGGGRLALHLAWEAIEGSEARELAWVTHLMNSGGGLPGSAILPAPLVTSTLAASGEKQPRNSAPRPTPPGCAPHPQGC